jgi:hypothetical protein
MSPTTAAFPASGTVDGGRAPDPRYEPRARLSQIASPTDLPYRIHRRTEGELRNQQVLYTDSIFLSSEVEGFDWPGEGVFLLRNPAREGVGDDISLPQLWQEHDRKMHELQGSEREVHVRRVRILRTLRCFHGRGRAAVQGST